MNEFLGSVTKPKCQTVISIVNREIAKLEQQVYLNVSEQIKDMIKVNTEIKENSDSEIFTEGTSEREETTFQYRSCLELLEKGGKTENGIYRIYPISGEMSSLRVFCDQSTDGGGWTVFQRRKDGSVDFFRTWNEYKAGFGSLDGEFWLGNDRLNVLTLSGNHELRIDLEDWDNGERCYAKYNDFHIEPEIMNYTLLVTKFSEGTCGDSLTYHSDMQFSTKDRDNDKQSYNCAEKYKGGWWYNSCLYSGLNGKYYKTSTGADGVYWYHWKKSYTQSCKSSEMKFR